MSQLGKIVDELVDQYITADNEDKRTSNPSEHTVIKINTADHYKHMGKTSETSESGMKTHVIKVSQSDIHHAQCSQGVRRNVPSTILEGSETETADETGHIDWSQEIDKSYQEWEFNEEMKIDRKRVRDTSTISSSEDDLNNIVMNIGSFVNSFNPFSSQANRSKKKPKNVNDVNDIDDV